MTRFSWQTVRGVMDEGVLRAGVFDHSPDGGLSGVLVGPAGTRLINEDASVTGIRVRLELTGDRRLSTLEAARAALAKAIALGADAIAIGHSAMMAPMSSFSSRMARHSAPSSVARKSGARFTSRGNTPMNSA